MEDFNSMQHFNLPNTYDARWPVWTKPLLNFLVSSRDWVELKNWAADSARRTSWAFATSSLGCPGRSWPIGMT